MVTTIGFLDLGAPELLIILAIALLLFGSKRLPELSKSLGQSIGEVKKGVASATDLKSEIKTQAVQTKQALYDDKSNEVR